MASLNQASTASNGAGSTIGLLRELASVDVDHRKQLLDLALDPKKLQYEREFDDRSFGYDRELMGLKQASDERVANIRKDADIGVASENRQGQEFTAKEGRFAAENVATTQADASMYNVDKQAATELEKQQVGNVQEERMANLNSDLEKSRMQKANELQEYSKGQDRNAAHSLYAQGGIGNRRGQYAYAS